MPANLENSAVATGLEKVHFHSNPKGRQSKECSNYHTIALISHTSKVILKIVQVRLQQYMNRELPHVQAGFRKGRGTRGQSANIRWITGKTRKFQKNIYLCFLDYAKAFVWITTNSGKVLRKWEYQTTLPASWETCMQVKKQQLELDLQQWTGSKLAHQSCMLSPCLFILYAECNMWNTELEETQAGMKIVRRNINNLRYADDTTLMAESQEELKSLLTKVKEENEKAGLKLNIQKTKIMASAPITSWQIEGKRNRDKIYFLGLQNHCRLWLQPWN